MGKTSSLNAARNSMRQQKQGEKPYWVEVHDELVAWDPVKQVATCRVCHGEIKNAGWAHSHLRDCFGIS
jgi:hypothetical protein